jgi:hypothetical protein
VSFRFLGVPNQSLAKADRGVGEDEISIQSQRKLTFGDALCGAPGEDLDMSQHPQRKRMVGDQRQGCGQFRFGRREGRFGVGCKGVRAREHVRSPRFDDRIDVAGIGGDRAIEKAARLCDSVGRYTPVEPGPTLKIEVHRVGRRG